MPANRTDDRAAMPRIESHSMARGGRTSAGHSERRPERPRAPARPEPQERRASRTVERTERAAPERPVTRAASPSRRPQREGSLLAVLETHQRDMQLARIRRQAAAGAPPAPEAPARKKVDLRQLYKRDPKDPRSPLRPSITTLSQRQSYGPQNFGRDDVIDKPRDRSTIQSGGGGDLQMPAPAPPSAAAAAAAQERAGPSIER